MNDLKLLLKTIRSVSKTNPVTYMQLSEMIRRLWRNKTSVKVIAFETDKPSIADYSIYEAAFGPYPEVKLYTIDESGNRVARPELPYFVMVDGKIDSVLFTAMVDGELLPLPDGIQTGIITIK